MPKLNLFYPDGVAGIGLLLMRVSYAVIAFSSLGGVWPGGGWLVVAPVGALALALVAGCGTRAAAFLLALALVAELFTARGQAALFLVASIVGVGALVLLGPGAYSADAHRFGRRVIRLGARSPGRGRGA